MSTIHGLLINYEDAAMLEQLSNDEIGFIVRASVRFQRDGEPMPETNNPAVKMILTRFEYLIIKRLNGQKGGKANHERNAQNYTENPGHFTYQKPF